MMYFANKKLDKGAVTIVEASIVFPITLFILFFLIYFGNAYFVKANMDAIVSKYAIAAAAECADPQLKFVKDNGRANTNVRQRNYPYRYLTSGYAEGTVLNSIKPSLKKEVDDVTGFLMGMRPSINKCSIQYNNSFIYQTISVEVAYEMQFPIRFVLSEKNTVLKLHAKDEVSVGDAPEIILNTNMVIDYYERSPLKTWVDGIKDKVSKFFS